MTELTQNDITEIREKIGVLERELGEYKYLLTELENGETTVEAIIRWIDDTDELKRL